MGLFGKKDQARPSPTDGSTTRAVPHRAAPDSSRLSPEDRARLTAEGTPADEIAWIDTWLSDTPGSTLEDLARQEAQLVAALRSYRTVMEEAASSKGSGLEPDERLREARATATAELAQIDRAVLARGFAEISANGSMRVAYKNVSLGLIRTALESESEPLQEPHDPRPLPEQRNRSR